MCPLGQQCSGQCCSACHCRHWLTTKAAVHHSLLQLYYAWRQHWAAPPQCSLPVQMSCSGITLLPPSTTSSNRCTKKRPSRWLGPALQQALPSSICHGCAKPWYLAGHPTSQTATCPCYVQVWTAWQLLQANLRSRLSQQPSSCLAQPASPAAAGAADRHQLHHLLRCRAARHSPHP